MIAKEDSCCGCNACYAVCPAKAITPCIDERGFYRVEVVEDRCIHCGYCEKVCPLKNPKYNEEQNEAFAFQIDDLERRLNSQSGGAFLAIADEFIKNDGIVYGVSFDGARAFYRRISKRYEIEKLIGSKYIQADTGYIYISVKDDLERHNKVLFSGTPCHVMGLLNYLEVFEVKKENLFTIDLICHGVPSPLIYVDYKKMLESKYEEVINFNFRDKIFGWNGYTCSFFSGNVKYYTIDFATIFCSDICLNHCCFECKFTRLNRVGDVTIGDLWGSEMEYSGLIDNLGTSLVKINNKAGEILTKEMRRVGKFTSIEIKKCYQRNLYLPTPMPAGYDDFWKCYFKEGFGVSIKKFLIHDFSEKCNKYYFWQGFYVDLLIEQIRCKEVFLYGIGVTLFQLVELLQEERILIQGILDRHEDYIGKTYKRIPVLSQDKLPNDRKFTVVICSKNENNIAEIRRRLQKMKSYKYAQVLSLIDFHE